MKPDTILETLIGKIAQDEDCLNAYVKPETKLDTYLDKIARLFRLAPVTSPLNANSYLMSDGTNGAVWVKPLEVVFWLDDNAEPHCSKTNEEILTAYLANRPIEAFVDLAHEQHYTLTITGLLRETNTLVFSCVSLIPNRGGFDTVTIACSIDGNDVVRIETQNK